MNVWSLSLPFFILSAGLTLALVRWTPRSQAGSPEVRRGSTSTGLLHRAGLALLLFLPWALALVVASILNRTALHSSSRTYAFYVGVAATVAPQLVLHTCLVWALFRRGYFTTSEAPQEQVRAGARAALIVHVLATVSFAILFWKLGPDIEAYISVVAVLIISLVAILTASRTASLADQGKATELEDIPLRDEILTVAAAFGWAPRGVRVYKVRRDEVHPAEGEILQGLDQWRTDFNPLRPALPDELLRTTDAPVISAGMAMRYAHGILLNPFRFPAMTFGPLRIPGVLGAGLVAGGLGIVLFLILLSLGEGPGDAAMLAYWALILVGFIGAFIAVRVRRRNYHTYAYSAWSQVNPAGNRSPEEFVAALALFDRAVKHVSDPESILSRYERDAGLLSFLESQGSGVRERALAHARTALTAP